MPWYKAGTVSVVQNSNTVVGTNTAFIVNSRVGDGFRGPDGGWYEVTNIASDTALSIDPPYQGATNAAGGYALAPLQGYVKYSADALRALVNQFGGMLAVLGSVPTTAGVRDALGLSDTDGLPEGDNLYFTAARAIGAVLSGFALADGAVTAADSVLTGLGKLQKQVSAAVKRSGDTLSGALNEAPIATLASSATPAIGAATANSITITGTTGITGFDSIAAGATRTLIFSGALTLSHNATSLILPGGASITTASGDIAEFLSLGSGNWVCTRYSPASGQPVAVTSVAKGGTGGTTPAAARTALGLKSAAVADILGTVSQSGGVPTGAIFENGTNANGTYVKYADGRMECSRKVNFALSPNTAWQSVYITGLVAAQAFAATFTAAPEIDITLTMSSGYSGTGWLSGIGEPTTTTWPTYYITDAAARGATSYNVHYKAKGRWS